jgi:hypothetical protein
MKFKCLGYLYFPKLDLLEVFDLLWNETRVRMKFLVVIDQSFEAAADASAALALVCIELLAQSDDGLHLVVRR